MVNSEASRYKEYGSGDPTHEPPTRGPGTNGNRVSDKSVHPRYLDTGNMNLAPKRLGNPPENREPMKLSSRGTAFEIIRVSGDIVFSEVMEVSLCRSMMLLGPNECLSNVGKLRDELLQMIEIRLLTMAVSSGWHK